WSAETSCPVFRALFGQLPGGSAIVTALACAFFTSFTGASGVTIVAVAALLMPVLVADRYSEKASLGLVTGAGSLGLLFPPCLPLILYAIVANVPIESIFLAGILPGLAMVAGTAWWGILQGQRSSVERQAFTWTEARASRVGGEMGTPAANRRIGVVVRWVGHSCRSCRSYRDVCVCRRGAALPGSEIPWRRPSCDGGMRTACGRRPADSRSGARIERLFCGFANHLERS